MSDGFNKKVGVNEVPSVILQEGESFIGKYKGSKKINVRGEERNIHLFEKDGNQVMMWGCGLLDYLLSKVDVDTDVKVVYLGKERTKIDKKIRNINKYEVYIKG